MDGLIVAQREWFNYFCTYVKLKRNKPNEPHLLLLDGHISNWDNEMIENAKKENIFILQFPPHTTHILQPLDNHFFRQLKQNIRHAKGKDSFNKIKDKWDVVRFLSDVIKQTGIWDTIEISFEKAGVWPPRYKEEFVIEDITLKDVFEPSVANQSSLVIVDNSGDTITPEIRNSQEINLQMSQVSITIPRIITPDESENQLVYFPLNEISSINPLATSITQTQFSLNNNSELIKMIQDMGKRFDLLEETMESVKELQESQAQKKNKNGTISTKGGILLTSSSIDEYRDGRNERIIRNQLKKLEKEKLEKQDKLLAIQYRKENRNSISPRTPLNLLLCY